MSVTTSEQLGKHNPQRRLAASVRTNHFPGTLRPTLRKRRTDLLERLDGIGRRQVAGDGRIVVKVAAQRD